MATCLPSMSFYRLVQCCPTFLIQWTTDETILEAMVHQWTQKQLLKFIYYLYCGTITIHFKMLNKTLNTPRELNFFINCQIISQDMNAKRASRPAIFCYFNLHKFNCTN